MAVHGMEDQPEFRAKDDRHARLLTNEENEFFSNAAKLYGTSQEDIARAMHMKVSTLRTRVYKRKMVGADQIARLTKLMEAAQPA